MVSAVLDIVRACVRHAASTRRIDGGVIDLHRCLVVWEVWGRQAIHRFLVFGAQSDAPGTHAQSLSLSLSLSLSRARARALSLTHNLVEELRKFDGPKLQAVVQFPTVDEALRTPATASFISSTSPPYVEPPESNSRVSVPLSHVRTRSTLAKHTCTGFQRQMQERASADMSTVPIWRCTQLRCDTSLSCPPESCVCRSGWSTCTMKMAGADVYPYRAPCVDGRAAEDAKARSPSSDHAHAETTSPAGSGGAPSGTPSRFSVHTSRILHDDHCPRSDHFTLSPLPPTNQSFM